LDRIFLDANVLFSAAWRDDAGLQRLWRLAGTTLVTSSYALEEARRNLPDERQRQRLQKLATDLEIGEARQEASVPAGIALPTADRPILGAAIATGATHLLTGDRRAFGPYFDKTVSGVLIPKPATYLAGRR
jgi:predicted nucleic acid-binding protein